MAETGSTQTPAAGPAYPVPKAVTAEADVAEPAVPGAEASAEAEEGEASGTIVSPGTRHHHQVKINIVTFGNFNMLHGQKGL